MTCCVCGTTIGKVIKVTPHVRNVCSLSFEMLGRGVHPRCVGLIPCPSCKKHWIKAHPCRCDPLTNAIRMEGGDKGKHEGHTIDYMADVQADVRRQ